MTDIILSASILSANFKNLERDIKTTEDAGIDWIHIDVMDGNFVPNISMGAFIVDTCRQITNLPLDVHLMINNPERHIRAFIDAGANRISIHAENNPNVVRTLQEIRELHCSPGLAINPGTSVGSVETLVNYVDMILVMTVNPGFSGQTFMPEMVEKVMAVRKLVEDKNQPILIQVDGGINPHNIKLLSSAGATVFVAATSIFKSPGGIAAGIESLRVACS